MGTFRKSQLKDLERIMELINDGRIILKRQRTKQWGNLPPTQEIIKSDIKSGISYVYEEDGKILATVALSFSGQNDIEGNWVTSGTKFAWGHRLALDKNQLNKGIGKKLVQTCLKEGVVSIRGATHFDNQNMKSRFLRNGYVFCGTFQKYGYKGACYEKILPRPAL